MGYTPVTLCFIICTQSVLISFKPNRRINFLQIMFIWFLFIVFKLLHCYICALSTRRQNKQVNKQCLLLKWFVSLFTIRTIPVTVTCLCTHNSDGQILPLIRGYIYKFTIKMNWFHAELYLLKLLHALHTFIFAAKAWESVWCYQLFVFS